MANDPLADVIRTHWQKTKQKHGIFDDRLSKLYHPFLDLFQKIGKIVPPADQLSNRTAVLIQFIKEAEQKNAWNFERDPEKLLEAELHNILFLEQKLKHKKEVRKELKTFLTQFPYGLEKLDIQHIPLKYGHLEHLKQLTTLKELKINATHLAEREIDKLRKQLPGVSIRI